MKRKRYKKKSKHKFAKLFITYMIILATTTYATSKVIQSFETLIEPLVYELAQIYSINLLTTLVDDIIEKELIEEEYKTSDFYNFQIDKEGYITVFEVNNLLINDLTTKISNSLQSKLIDTSEKIISIPIGEVLFVEYFSDIGPSYKYGIIPIGYGKVKYETVFDSIGVNQTNFKVFLNISVSMKIVNPLYEKDFVVEKDVILLDAMISGKVPTGMILDK